MKLHLLRLAAIVTGATALQAGTMIDPGKKIVVPAEDPITGALTFGYQGSEDLHTGFIDSMTPLWTPGDSVLFSNSRYSLDDSDQFVASAGLIFRSLISDSVIVGANVYYDSLDTAYGHHFDQVGFGVEVLTKWVDFRANYYLPDQKREVIQKSTRREVIRDIERGSTSDEIRDTSVRRDFERYESALEGFNTELGFLVPAFENIAEIRLFGGYYHYLNPFGSDYDGFKARFEARVRKGVYLDAEYWDDKNLTGGHWTGGVRVSLPCNIFNVFAGRNPFEGASETFGPPGGDMRDRLNEMVIRSHRVKTASSGLGEAGGEATTETKTVGKVAQATPRPTPPPSSPTPPPQKGARRGSGNAFRAPSAAL